MKQNDYGEYRAEEHILRYTTYKIHELIVKTLKEVADIDQFINSKGVSKEIFDMLMRPCKVYTVEMYIGASKLTGISYDDLTAIDKVSVTNKYRKSTKRVDELTRSDYDFAYFLFKDIIYNAKLADKEE